MSQTKSLIAIDPGKSSGVALFNYTDETPATLVGVRQLSDGIREICDEVSGLTEMIAFSKTGMWTVVCERFVPLTEDGFSHTSDSLEPLRIEGALIDRGIMSASYSDDRWQRASCQLITGSGNDETRKQASNALLEKHGMWYTGADVGQPNADDAISAIKHGIYYMKNTVKHRPTQEKFWPKTT